MLKQAQARETLVNLPLEALQLHGVFLEGVLELPERELPGRAFSLGLSRCLPSPPPAFLPRPRA